MTTKVAIAAVEGNRALNVSLLTAEGDVKEEHAITSLGQEVALDVHSGMRVIVAEIPETELVQPAPQSKQPEAKK